MLIYNFQKKRTLIIYIVKFLHPLLQLKSYQGCPGMKANPGNYRSNEGINHGHVSQT